MKKIEPTSLTKHSINTCVMRIDELGNEVRFSIEKSENWPNFIGFYPAVSNAEHIHWDTTQYTTSNIPLTKTRNSSGKIVFFCKECGLRFLLENCPMKQEEIIELFKKYDTRY